MFMILVYKCSENIDGNETIYNATFEKNSYKEYAILVQYTY